MEKLCMKQWFTKKEMGINHSMEIDGGICKVTEKAVCVYLIRERVITKWFPKSALLVLDVDDPVENEWGYEEEDVSAIFDEKYEEILKAKNAKENAEIVLEEVESYIANRHMWTFEEALEEAKNYRASYC